MGAFCAIDLLLFYIFFEFTLVPLFLIIGIWGGPERRIAANKFFIYTITGSLLTFAGVLYLALQARNFGGLVSFEIPKLLQLSQAGALSPNVQAWVFLALFAGFAVKVPLFPFHTWLPLAHTEAPTTGSVFLAGLLLKLGTYGFLRFCLPILPVATRYFAPLMAALAVIAILYGALAAWAQKDFKRLVAYSSVSHMGFCILGLFTLKSIGVAGALLYMINHGISTGALFFVVGMIYDRYHTHRFGDIAGLAGKMPRLTFFAVLFGLSSMALPGLNGFVSEFMVLAGTFISATDRGGSPPGPLHLAYGFFAAGGIILSAVYMLYFIRQIFFGPEHLPEADPTYPADLNKREIATLTPLAILVVLLGLWPGPILRAIDPACTAIVNTIFQEPAQPPTNPLLVNNDTPGGMVTRLREAMSSHPPTQSSFRVARLRVFAKPCLFPIHKNEYLNCVSLANGKANNPWR
jgi:NADH-quinone oxidoreductase subunit M